MVEKIASRKQGLIHYHTSGKTSGNIKKPNSSDLYVGEIAINNNIDEPSLFIKNSSGTVSQFVDKKYIEDHFTNPVIGDGTLTIQTGATGNLSTAKTFKANQSGNQSVTIAKVANTGSYNDLSNKPGIATTSASGMMSSTMVSKLNGIESGAEVNVQSDWNATSGDALILNKPTIPAAANNGALTITTATTGMQLGNFSANQSTNTTVTLHKVAATGNYNDLDGKPSIPTVNNKTITITTNNSATAGTFTLNQSSNKTIDITVPTKVSDLNNDSNFIASGNVVTALSNKVDKVNGKGLSTNDFSDAYKGKLDNIASGAEVNVQADWSETGTTSDAYIKNKPTIPTVNDSTITIQKNGSTVKSFTLNQATGETINITVPTNVNELTNDAGYITTADTKDFITSAVTKLKFFATSSDTVTALNGKQGTISDLAKIRSDAASGYSAYQTLTGHVASASHITSTERTNWNKKIDSGVTAMKNFATSANVVTALSGKANTGDIKDSTITIQKNGTNVDSFTLNQSSNKTINITVPTSASDINALPTTTKYAASMSLDVNSSTYVVTAQLKDQDGNNLGTAQTIDLPLESVVVNGAYIASGKTVQLTLQNGNKIEFSVADLVSGLQTEITSTNKLSADLIQDGTNNKVYTATEQTKLSGIEANAQKNGDAYKTIQINGTTSNLSANNSAATFIISAGTNIQLTSGTRKVTISATDTKPGKLITSASSTQTVSTGETMENNIILHKISKTGKYSDLIGAPTIPAAANNGALTITTATTGMQLGNFSANQSTNTTVKLHKVAATGSYNDLSDKPTIPSAGTASPKNVASTSAVGTSVKYAREDHQHKIEVATGDANGQVKIAGQNVSVAGLGSAAYTTSGTYATASHNQALSTITGADDLKAIEALTGTSGLLKKTAANTWSLDTTKYIASGDAVTALNNKVDKVNGKGLSTNDFDNAYKGKLDNIASGAEVNVQADWSETGTTSDAYIKNKPTIPTVNDSTITIKKNNTTVDSFTLNQSTAKTINITVPTNVSDLTNDSNFIASASVVTALSNKPDVAFKTINANATAITATSSADTVTLTGSTYISLAATGTGATKKIQISATGLQPSISDLAEIRSNASSGYSAYTGLTGHTVSASHITATERTNWNKKIDSGVTAMTYYATSADVVTALNNKADDSEVVKFYGPGYGTPNEYYCSHFVDDIKSKVESNEQFSISFRDTSGRVWQPDRIVCNNDNGGTVVIYLKTPELSNVKLPDYSVYDYYISANTTFNVVSPDAGNLPIKSSWYGPNLSAGEISTLKINDLLSGSPANGSFITYTANNNSSAWTPVGRNSITMNVNGTNYNFIGISTDDGNGLTYIPINTEYYCDGYFTNVSGTITLELGKYYNGYSEMRLINMTGQTNFNFSISDHNEHILLIKNTTNADEEFSINSVVFYDMVNNSSFTPSYISKPKDPLTIPSSGCAEVSIIYAGNIAAFSWRDDITIS